MGKNKNPSYVELHHNGILTERVLAGRSLLEKCRVCPHGCGADRLNGQLGICRVGARARVASFGPHFGEESPLVGRGGSGTIFFEGCNLLCIFCQNSDISHIDERGDASPQAVDDRQLAEMMLHLQDQGCHNINLVTPSHVAPQILSALPHAVEKGLRLPLVFNTGGYDSPATLRLLDGIIDIYMPDCKFITAAAAKKYTSAPDYPEVMQKSIAEMFRQVGNLEITAQGIAVRGLLVRHLVMPGLLDETEGVLEFLADTISRKTYINIMDQYRPCHRAFNVEPINRGLSGNEYEQALQTAKRLGLHNLDQRDWSRILRFTGQ